MTDYQIIGDIHGQHGALEALLGNLHWTKVGGQWRPPADTMAVFVGDLIDRGKGQAEVLSTVRSLVDAGHAHCVMGNHEFNAVCFATEHSTTGDPLREHSQKNLSQHSAFLALDADERAEWIEWFKELPLWLTLDDRLRVVHACWRDEDIATFGRELDGAVIGDRIEFWERASNKRTSLGSAIEVVLKGPELELAHYDLPRFVQVDKDSGNIARAEARICWWRSGVTRLSDLVDIPKGALDPSNDLYSIDPEIVVRGTERSWEYDAELPVIYGHYWRSWAPAPGLDHTPLTACVDFSAAKGGPLVAYRWNGELAIDPSNYVQSGHS